MKKLINSDFKNPDMNLFENHQKSSELKFNVNHKDSIKIVLGDKLRELKHLLKMKKEQNGQLLNQLQNLTDKSNDLCIKRANLLASINEQKSLIYVLKNKNKSYRNYLSDLTSKTKSDYVKKTNDYTDIFRSISSLSENLSENIVLINKVIANNSVKLNMEQNELLSNMPIDFLKSLDIKLKVIS